MIIVRAPLRISFIGGGTDLPDFYRRHTGRVISATIDKSVYLVVNSTPLLDEFIIKYSSTEVVKHPKQLEHNLIREALLDLGLDNECIEIGSFADLPAKTGLGSSSSFSVALLKGLNAFRNKRMNKTESAEAACRLEIDLVGSPIGKQDQYATAFGGFNIFQFNKDDSVDVEPVFLGYKNRAFLEKHLLLFFTGIMRDASSVLSSQRLGIKGKTETYKKMSEDVFEFRDKLLKGDAKGMGLMLHKAWEDKKSLSKNISSSVIDKMFDVGVGAGAWGGKILGAGGGGCILFLAPPKKHESIKSEMKKLAQSHKLDGFKELPVKFTQAGAEILFNARRGFSFD